ncbi:MAG: DUF5686 and carboxypeptidase regulatory-like domain-containing protein [Vicingaceae bacterium]
MRLSFFLILFVPLMLLAQNNNCRLEGKIQDKEGNPIPYTSIYFPEIAKGAMANIEGDFSINLACRNYQVKVQSMGYQSKSLYLDLSKVQELNITLLPAVYQLNEVVVDPNSEDPAYNIIRKATAMAEYYKEQITAYQATLYVRNFFDVDKLPWIAKKFAEEDELAELKTGDIEETILEYSYRKPNEVKEKILGRKTGRFDTLRSSSSYINLNFYNLGGSEMINPLSRGAFTVYKFEYQNTTFEGNLKVHKIKIIPRRRGNDLMSGFIYINDGIWNLNKVDVEFEQPMAHIKYKQIYNKLGDLVWMPTNHQLEVTVSVMGFEMLVNYLATLKNIKVETDSVVDQRILSSIRLPAEAQKDSSFTQTKTERKALSKRQKKIDELIQKQELNKRETFKLVRLIKAESEEREKKDTARSLERSISRKVEFADSAFHLSDSAWNSMRDVPLTEKEVEIYDKRDSLNRIQSGDTIINKERGLVDKILFFNGTLRGRNKLLHYEPKGILAGLSPSFNTVDGWLLQKELFTFRYDDYKGKRFEISPSLSYAFAREQFMGQLDFEGTFNPKKRARVFASAGRKSSDFNRRHRLDPVLNTFSTLIFTENYPKFYQEDFIQMGHQRDLANGLVLQLTAAYSDRIALQNNSSQKVFDFMDQDYTSNLPLHPDVLENPSLVAQNKAFNLQVDLEYTPEQYYRFRGHEKRMLGSKYPSFKLSYRQGVPDVFDSESNYKMLRFSIQQSKPIRLIDEVSYKLSAGKFISRNTLNFADYENFNVNPAYLMFNNFSNSFKQLDYYAFNSKDYFIEGHFAVQNNHLLLKYLPLLNQTEWKERVEFNYLYTEQKQQYYEFGYSLDRILLMMNVGAFVGFVDHQYQSFGIRLGLNIEGLE